MAQTAQSPPLRAAEEVSAAGNGNGAVHKPAPHPITRTARQPSEVPAGGEVSPAGKTLAERIRALQHSAARH